MWTALLPPQHGTVMVPNLVTRPWCNLGTAVNVRTCKGLEKNSRCRERCWSGVCLAVPVIFAIIVVAKSV